MDAQTLAAAMNHTMPLDYYKRMLPYVEQAMIRCGCTNFNRASMFLAQVGHESVGLKYMLEIADGSAYNWRSDLGNTQPGDGPRFKGRGPIQLTGRSNYTRCSAWAYKHKYVPTRTYLVDHPTKLEDWTYAWLGTVWYWTVSRPQLNRLSDNRDMYGATRAINGGLNGLEDRQNRYAHTGVLGTRSFRKTAPTPPP